MFQFLVLGKIIPHKHSEVKVVLPYCKIPKFAGELFIEDLQCFKFLF